MLAQEHKAGLFPMERSFLSFTMRYGDETAAHVSAQTVLCLQSCMDKAPSSPGWGMIEEDQGTAVKLVHTAVIDCCLQVPVLALGWSWSQHIVGLNCIRALKD